MTSLVHDGSPSRNPTRRMRCWAATRPATTLLWAVRAAAIGAEKTGSVRHVGATGSNPEATAAALGAAASTLGVVGAGFALDRQPPAKASASSGIDAAN